MDFLPSEEEDELDDDDDEVDDDEREEDVLLPDDDDRFCPFFLFLALFLSLSPFFFSFFCFFRSAVPSSSR